MAYEHQEYPKWVCGQIVQDEDGEAAALAAPPVKPEPIKGGDTTTILRASPQVAAGIAAAVHTDDRKAITSALTERGVSFFKGAPTEVLKAKLAEQG